MQQSYGDIIWTNHALERLSGRGIAQDDALRTFRSPDKSFPGKKKGTYEYIKYFGEKRVTLIGKQNEQRQWIILSAWVDPPLVGSEDEKRQKAYYQYKNSKGWKKFFLLVKKQLGF